MAKFLLEKYLAHIYVTAEYIKRQYICEVKPPQANCSWSSSWHSLQSKGKFYGLHKSLHSGDSQSKYQHNFFWEPISFQTLSNS